jgi:hypothetical protein
VLASVVLGVFAGVSVAFMFSPDPTGLFPIGAGLVLSVLFAAIFYGGIGKMASSDPA